MESQSKWPLIIGIAVPVILVLALVIFVYVPIFSIKPQYNFLYYSLSNSSYRCYDFNPYQVVGGKIEKTPLPVETINSRGSNDSDCIKLYASSTPQLYLFDVEENDYRKVSFEEAQTWQLSSDLVSPDDIKVISGYNGSGWGGIFGGGSSRDSAWLEGKKGTKEIKLSPSIDNYYQFKFVGWVTK